MPDIALPMVQAGNKPVALVPVSLREVQEVASIIARSGMAPKSYLKDSRNYNLGFSEEKIQVGIMHGLEVGMTPLAALQSIAVINGTPSLWGDGALGLVYSSGLMEDIEETVEDVGEGDKKDLVALCTIKRKGRATPIVGRFSWRDAQRAGLDKKAGPWQEYPRRMLKMRARAWALRDGFAEVLRGLPIAEEVADIPQEPAIGIARPKREDFGRPANATDAEIIPERSEGAEASDETEGFDPELFASGFESLIAEAKTPQECLEILDENHDDLQLLDKELREALARKANARITDLGPKPEAAKTEEAEPAAAEKPVGPPDIATPYYDNRAGREAFAAALIETLAGAKTEDDLDTLLVNPVRAERMERLREKAPKNYESVNAFIAKARALLAGD